MSPGQVQQLAQSPAVDEDAMVLASFVASTDDGVAMVGLDGRVLTWNAGAERIYGWTEREIVGRHWGDIVEPESRRRANRLARTVSLGASLRDVHIRHVDRDGRPLEISLALSPQRDQAGEITGVFAVMRDVTKARADHDRFEAIFRSVSDGLLLLDDQMRVLALNQAACRLLGGAAEELLGRDSRSLLADPSDPTGHDKRLEAARWAGGLRDLFRFRRLDDEVIDVDVSFHPDVVPGQHLAVWRDMTERVRHEAEQTRRVAQQTAIAQLGRRALEGLEIGRLLHEALTLSTRVLDAHVGAIFEAVDEVTLRARSATEPELMGVVVTEEEDSPAARAFAQRKPLVVGDWSQEPRLPGGPFAGYHLAASLTVLVGPRRSPWGVLAIHRSEPGDWMADQVEFLEAISNVLADAIGRWEAEQSARHQALHDPLTGLPNRAAMLDRLGHALSLAGRRQTWTAVVMVDVDHFKLVNETLGHEAGDDLLRSLSPRLTRAVRASDTVARFASNQFAILCEDLDSAAAALDIADRARGAFAEPFELADGLRILTASIGIAVAGGDSAPRPSDLMRDAEAAMARAKVLGRDRTEVFDEAMRRAAILRVGTERSLRTALDLGEVVPYFQPIVATDNRTIQGFEALARWVHPDRGVVPPSEFIGVAEDSGLIVPVGETVLRQACGRLREWMDAGHVLDMHVNVAARQLADSRLPERVATIIREAGVPPGRVVLEITESTLMESGHDPLETLGALRRSGVRVVLDDFGTGYSSLSYLQRFPIEGLKIDRSFVATLGEGEAEAAIVEAVLRLGDALGLQVVAEGVEEEGQLARLRSLGCTLAQGYLFARPQPAADVDRLLASLASAAA